jgi:hypothetical protein
LIVASPDLSRNTGEAAGYHADKMIGGFVFRGSGRQSHGRQRPLAHTPSLSSSNTTSHNPANARCHNTPQEVCDKATIVMYD